MTDEKKAMLRPPVNRAMRSLDRSFFQKKVSLSAARIMNNRLINKCRSSLSESGDILVFERGSTIRPDPDPDLAAQGRRCLLLHPKVKHDDPASWSTVVQKLHGEEEVSLIPYTLSLDYDYWTYADIMSSIIPEEDVEESPTGFTRVGHIAHLNLRDQYLPYKYLIADVLRDKNAGVRTVINKIESVGTTSEFRTFPYEVLAGEDDLRVDIRESGCTFRFDFAKVYWNSRLNTEHDRIIATFKPGEAVCDVMAGVGPFALPAGKKGVHVWANDLNPDCYTSLEAGIRQNKVGKFVKGFNQDGRSFIPYAVQEWHKTRTHAIPLTFDHFVMNLPATAITFLDSFIGSYRNFESSLKKLPLVHVYCFAGIEGAEERIGKDISDRLGVDHVPEISIRNVRHVAPQKWMFCASFRLPPEAAFARK